MDLIWTQANSNVSVKFHKTKLLHFPLESLKLSWDLSNKIMQYLRLLTIQLILLWSPWSNKLKNIILKTINSKAFYFNEFFQHWLRLFLRLYRDVLSISGFRSSVMFLFEVVFTMWFWGDVILVVIEIWEPMIRVLFDFFPFLKVIKSYQYELAWYLVGHIEKKRTHDMLRRPSVGP